MYIAGAKVCLVNSKRFAAQVTLFTLVSILSKKDQQPGQQVRLAMGCFAILKDIVAPKMSAVPKVVDASTGKYRDIIRGSAADQLRVIAARAYTKCVEAGAKTGETWLLENGKEPVKSGE